MKNEILKFADLPLQRTIKWPAPEDIVDGDPKQYSSVLFQSEDELMTSGIWESEVGSYRLHFSEHKNEFFQITSGRVRVHQDGGPSYEYGPGDVCILPANFRGIFEVVERTQKNYVVTGV